MKFKHSFVVGCFVYLLTCLHGFVLDHENTRRINLDVQAEEMEIMNGTVSDRSDASNLKAVHLYQGSTLTFDFCLMSPTVVTLNGVVFSNDGPSDTVSVDIDNQRVAHFSTDVYAGHGGGWNVFRKYKIHNDGILLSDGRHRLILTVVHSDTHGVEIDFSELALETTQNIPSLKCEAFCFDTISYEDDLPYPTGTHGSALAKQKSYRTQCAEEDNINIPVFRPAVKSFVVAATKPKYTSFVNSRGADWEHCQMMKAFWRYNSVHLTNTQQIDDHATMSVTKLSNKATQILVTFALNGKSTGSTDAYVGTNVFLKEIRTGTLHGNITLKFQYLNHNNQWSTPQVKTLESTGQELNFTTPDFAFSESKSNQIRLEIETFQNDIDNMVIGEFYMFKRTIRSDVSETIYTDSTIIIEGVHIDMWWRINESMTVSVTGSDHQYTGLAYVRIYERVPWEHESYSQIFVMYQDGNVRLLQITPHGLDWIPFGSSVLIGQSDPQDVRPSAPIKHIEIDPCDMFVKIDYSDGGWLTMNIKPAWTETVLVVNNSSFVRNTNDFPFFTFRSMWTENGNGDVDHVTVGDGQNYRTLPILGQWGSLSGNFFAFYRKCISRHNTLSPDILLKITG